jgi:hypothetical protein
MGATTQGGSLGFVMEAGRVVEVWAGSVSRGTTSNPAPDHVIRHVAGTLAAACR